MVSAILHRVAHWLGLNYGRVETWHDEDRLLVGFRCTSCGRIEDVHERDGDLL